MPSPTHLAINPASSRPTTAAGLDVQIMPMDPPTDPRYSREHGDAEALAFDPPPPVPPEVWAARDRLFAKAAEIVNPPYDMPPPSGWKVDGSVSPPVPYVVTEHPGYNGIGRFVDPEPAGISALVASARDYTHGHAALIAWHRLYGYPTLRQGIIRPDVWIDGFRRG